MTYLHPLHLNQSPPHHSLGMKLNQHLNTPSHYFLKNELLLNV